MIKYWNKWEGINWLDLKKKKSLLGMFSYKPNMKCFYPKAQSSIFKGYCTLVYTTYSSVGYTHGKEINGLQSPRGLSTLSACAINATRRSQSIPHKRSVPAIFQLGSTDEI